jgi:hypothetical protein
MIGMIQNIENVPVLQKDANAKSTTEIAHALKKHGQDPNIGKSHFHQVVLFFASGHSSRRSVL